jgi:acyl-CoA thioesterase YciA
VTEQIVGRMTAMPADLNPYGGVFGGWLMAQLALGASALAARRGRGQATIVAADTVRFPEAMKLGDELTVYAAIVREGRTSITVEARAEGRARHGEDVVAVASGQFSFVMIDDQGRPRPIDEGAA